jgi:hypothetical protein
MKKRTIGLCTCLIIMLFLFVGISHTTALADTITGITLYGGNGGNNWSWNGQGWTTTNSGWWVLGVSSTSNGALVNQPDTTISVPFNENYWLYAEPTFLGSTPKVDVTTDELGTLTTIFTLSGNSGTESPWSFLEGSHLLQLGWAAGTANKVGSGNDMSPSGYNDFYLHLQAGTPVPLPPSLLLLAPGLLGLVGLKRKYLR